MTLLPHYCIGIDGGGSSTRLLASNQHGKIVAEARSGPSNPSDTSHAQAARSIIATIDAAELETKALRSSRLALGIAGLASEESRCALHSALLELAPWLEQAEVHLTHDLEIAHHAAFSGDPGVLIAAGTGSACYAIDREGQVHRASGRANTFDDPGSGYALAKYAQDMRLIGRSEASDRKSIAALAPRVIELAESENPVALGIIATEAQRLLELATSVFEKLDEDMPFALSGSMLAQESILRRKFLSLLAAQRRNSSPTALRRSPVEAALALAQTSEKQARPVA